MNWRNDPHTCWTTSVIVSYVHLKHFRCLHRDSNPWPQQCQFSALPIQLWSQPVNLLGSCVPVKGMNLCDGWQRDELKKWSSHLFDNLSNFLICTPEKFQVSFNETSCAVYFTSSLIDFSSHSDLILGIAKDKDVAFLVVGDPFRWVTSEYHYSMHNGTILTVDIQRYFHLFGSW